jgi:hypothetical protein
VTDTPQTLLTATELADRWRIPTAAVRALTRRWEIPTVRLGNRRRYLLDVIERFEADDDAVNGNANASSTTAIEAAALRSSTPTRPRRDQ